MELKATDTNGDARRGRPDDTALIRLERLRWDEVESHLERDDAVIVPIGSTEQHGPHLPVGVDTMTAIAVSEDAAAATGAVLAPPIWYGWSPQHMGFPGTVTVRAETLIAVAEDVATSLIYHGFRRVIFVNGHRIANVPPLSIAATRVRELTGAVVTVADLGYVAQPEYAQAVANGSGGIAHADGYETGHMRYLDPDLVAKDRIPDADARRHAAVRAVDPNVPASRVAWWPSTSAEISASGHGAGGNPEWGTTARGATLHRAMVRDVAAIVTAARDAAVKVTRPPLPR